MAQSLGPIPSVLRSCSNRFSIDLDCTLCSFLPSERQGIGEMLLPGSPAGFFRTHSARGRGGGGEGGRGLGTQQRVADEVNRLT